MYLSIEDIEDTAGLILTYIFVYTDLKCLSYLKMAHMMSLQ